MKNIFNYHLWKTYLAAIYTNHLYYHTNIFLFIELPYKHFKVISILLLISWIKRESSGHIFMDYPCNPCGYEWMTWKGGNLWFDIHQSFLWTTSTQYPKNLATNNLDLEMWFECRFWFFLVITPEDFCHCGPSPSINVLYKYVELLVFVLCFFVLIFSYVPVDFFNFLLQE